jgi:hypothetical protein
MSAIVTLSIVFGYNLVPRPSKTPPSSAPPGPASPATMTSPPQLAPNDLTADFNQLKSRLNAKVGVVVSAVGGGQAPKVFGDWTEGPAWSTSKVPLVIAAYRQQSPRQVTDTMRAAITESDNAASERLWAQLGEPAVAGPKVQQILQDTGDPTIVEHRKVRPEFTAFGQTIWSLTNQVRFLASAYCNSENDPIFTLMGQVVSNQSWGIGDIPGTEFKGGWGPYPSGKYLVRQMGIVTTPTGKVAVAIAAEPASGQFADGTKDLGDIAKWLTDHFAALPAGKCGG